MKIIPTILICLLTVPCSQAQPAEKKYPVIGVAIPDFRLADVHYYATKTFDPGTIKGKWIIMDFWEKGCVACIQTFPKLNQLQNEFKDHIQFILVAKNDKKYNNNISQAYDRYRKRMNLDLPIAYDSVLCEQFGVRGVPHVIVIDPGKKVYAVTNSEFLSSQNLRGLVENRKPKFKKKYNVFEEQFGPNDTQWEYLANENEISQNNFLFRSILSVNQDEPFQGSWEIDRYAARGLYQVTRVSLYQLYNIAYLGLSEWTMGQPSLYAGIWKYPILQINDSSAFQFNYDNNSGFYNYSLTVPKEQATKERMMDVMQRDLQNYFGYEVSFETRMMSYWKLTATENGRKNLKTKGEGFEFKSDLTGLVGKKITIENILSEIELYNKDEQFPFIDETSIKDKIDISFSALMTDMDDLRKALRKQGLILEKVKKEMKVLVIRDRKPENSNN